MSFFNEKVVCNKDLDANGICYIKAAGVVYPDPSYVITRENSDTVVIAYIISGQAYLECNNACYPLYQGDCYIVPSRIYSKIYSDKKNPHSMSWINCTGKLIDNLINAYFGDDAPVIATCNIEKFITEIRNLLSIKSGISDLYAIALHKIIINVKKSLSISTESRENVSLKIEDRIRTYIVNHLQEKFSVDTLSQAFDMTTPQLIKLFKSKFNCTPYNYYLSLKIDIAKKMLSDTNLTVDDIAYRLNFLDRNHFAKTFAKKVGMTPSNYRKKFSEK